MTKHRIHHPKSAVERLTLPRCDGGRGLIHIRNLHNKQVRNLRDYFNTKTHTSHLHKSIANADKALTPLNLTQKNPPDSFCPIVTKEDLKLKWIRKPLHGRFPHELSHNYVDSIASHAWLSWGGIFPETEGFMMAIQDQVIHTKNYQKHILRDPSIQLDLCRRCHSKPETIQHITAACPLLSQSDYKNRHDQVGKIIHQKLACKYHLKQTKVPYYKYTPDVVAENASCRLYWDRSIITDKTMT